MLILTFVFFIGSFNISTFVVVPSAFTSNSTVVVDNLYPSGAIVSVSVNLPSFKPFIICTSSVEVHSSTTFPSESFTTKCAPGNSLLVVASFLLTSTFVTCFVFKISTFTVLSSFPTLNDTLFLFNWYPFGASTSSAVYSPTSKLSTTFAELLDLNLNTSFPLLFLTTIVAPLKVFFVALSILLIITFVFFIGSFNISTFVVVPSPFTVKYTVVVDNL